MPARQTTARQTGSRSRRTPRSQPGRTRTARRSAHKAGARTPRTLRAASARPVDRYAGFEGEATQEQVNELLLQAIETEIGGIQVYETALRCAQNPELRREWEGYLEQTRNHERILTDLFAERGLDTGRESPGRGVVRGLGDALVNAMETALEKASPEAAELVASECVTLAETKDHANWELLGEVAKALPGGPFTQALRRAHDRVEDEEDEHLYHTMGWSRELWLQSLGLPAVLPPPEEARDVKTAIAAARAKQERKKMLKATR